MSLAKRLRDALIDELRSVGPSCAVLLSSGTDSACALFALLELGRRPTVYSFMLDGRVSFDFAHAGAAARSLGLPFRSVILPADRPGRAAEEMVLGLGLRKKTGVQCAWPVARALDEIAERDVVTGHAGDGHFGLTRLAMTTCVDDLGALDALRARNFADPDYAQVATLRWYAGVLGKRLWTPWTAPRVISLFEGRPWRELNRPRQKEPARAAFKARFAAFRPRRHSDLHKGDSGIAASFDPLLLDERWNPRLRYKSLAGVFNEIARRGQGDRPLMIGEAPSRTSDPARPLSGRGFADALARLAGIRVSAWLRAFERRNLLDEWPGRQGDKGSAFPVAKARRAAILSEPDLAGRRAVLVGRRVAAAFRRGGEYLEWHRGPDGGRWAILPHPSGVNRWWNDPRNVARARRFMRKLAMEGER